MRTAPSGPMRMETEPEGSPAPPVADAVSKMRPALSRKSLTEVLSERQRISWALNCSQFGGGIVMFTDKEKKEKGLCAHPSCSCPVPKGEKYCSTYCHDAADTMEISCNCEHAGCALAEAV